MLTHSARWLDRYLEPFPIRSRGAFHMVSARRASTGARCVVVVPAPTTQLAEASTVLAEVHRVHDLLEHPIIPSVNERGLAGDVPFVELDCDADFDGVDVMRVVAESARKVPYGQADAFITSLREALQAAHAVHDPVCGGPVCLGRITYGNLLFSRAGAWSLVGFGRNFVIEKGAGAPDGSATVFQAPEVATGAAPNPVGDYVALLQLMRSLVPYVDMTATIGRIFRGELLPSDMELLDCVKWFDRRLLGEIAPLRASIEEGVAVSERIRALLGVTLDQRGFAATMATLLEGHEEANRDLDEGSTQASGYAEQNSIVIGPDGAWMARPCREPQKLGRAHRRILLALLQRRAQSPGATLAVPELLEAGWPGERPIPEAGANRVYVAVASLRRLGLGDLLERGDDGYRLSPLAIIRHVV